MGKEQASAEILAEYTHVKIDVPGAFAKVWCEILHIGPDSVTVKHPDLPRPQSIFYHQIIEYRSQ